MVFRTIILGQLILFILSTSNDAQTIFSTKNEIEIMKEQVCDSKSDNNYILQNFPNPFSYSTHLRLLVDIDMHLIIKVYDMNGRELNTVLDRFLI